MDTSCAKQCSLVHCRHTRLSQRLILFPLISFALPSHLFSLTPVFIFLFNSTKRENAHKLQPLYLLCYWPLLAQCEVQFQLHKDGEHFPRESEKKPRFKFPSWNDESPQEKNKTKQKYFFKLGNPLMRIVRGRVVNRVCSNPFHLDVLPIFSLSAVALIDVNKNQMKPTNKQKSKNTQKNCRSLFPAVRYEKN